MLSRWFRCLVVLLGTGLLVAASPRGRGDDSKLGDLIQQFRMLERNTFAFSAQRCRRMELLEKIAEYDTPQAGQFLSRVADEPLYIEQQEEILRLIARKRHYRDSSPVRELFLEHMRHDDPVRVIARSWLLSVFVERRDDSYLKRLFEEGTLEDRFLALQALGLIGNGDTINFAERLMRDQDWSPEASGAITCATIARSVARFQGERAARLLLLMKRDPRFSAADAHAMRDATRLWPRPDLASNITMGVLGDAQPGVRAEMARFMGDAGIEAARAPLVCILTDLEESPEVRAAAAEALGGLSIARADIVKTLSALLEDQDPQVVLGTVRGLARLRVRQAAQVLADLIGGPLEKAARDALALREQLPPETDWRRWLNSSDCKLPEGT